MAQGVGLPTERDVAADRTSAVLGQGVLLLVSLVLLSSVGGAGAVTAPVLVPLHLIAARASRSQPSRAGWALLAAVAAAEGAWALMYLIFGEGPATVAIPGLVGPLVGIAVYGMASRHATTEAAPHLPSELAADDARARRTE